MAMSFYQTWFAAEEAKEKGWGTGYTLKFKNFKLGICDFKGIRFWVCKWIKMIKIENFWGISL